MLSVIILAAGKGTRMKSEKPKVLFHTAGKPMIDYTIELSKSLNPEKIVVVTGNMAETVQEHLQDYSVDFALQKQQRGTADAVMAAQDFIDDNGELEGQQVDYAEEISEVCPSPKGCFATSNARLSGSAI